MLTLTAEIYERLDKLLDLSLFSWLVVIEMLDDTAFYLTSNNEPIVHEGHTHQPFPMKLGGFSDSGEGDLPSTTLTLSNVGKIITAHLENDQWDQAAVYIILIFKGDGSAGEIPAQLLRFKLAMQGASATHQNATLTLGQPNYLNVPFPPDRFLRETIFKGIPRANLR